jgi:fluoride ion exporter CrcB/FEX
VRMLRREQRLTNIWYAVATVLLAAVIALAGWTVWRA